MPRVDLAQFRRGTAAAWTAANPVLASGEPGFETNTAKFKIGDGTTAWASLTYQGDVSGYVPTTRTVNSKALSANVTLTTADVADSTNKRYVTDANLTVIGNTSGTNTGDQTSVSGNAGTATKLATARTINGTSFDGSANITIPMLPIGFVMIQTVSTNPATLLGYGTWTAIGAGKVLVGFASGDPDFGTAGASVGAKTSTPSAHSGAAVADHSAHTHSVTSNVAVGNHTATQPTIAWPAGVPTTSGGAVADHASHTHTYTDVPNHTHPHNIQGGTTAATTGTNVMASTATGGSARAMAIATSNNTSGVATGTTAGPSATLTHAVTNPTVAWPAGVPTATGGGVDAHSVTNNAVSSGNPSATLTHSVTQPANHSAMSVIQPSLVVYMFERTA